MNYNKAANGYSENRKFYHECVKKVKAFCKEKGIAYPSRTGELKAKAQADVLAYEQEVALRELEQEE